MHWIVQNNLYNEIAYNSFISALEAEQQNYTIVKVIPFVHTLIPDVSPTDSKVIVWGSTTLDMVALERGWTPGVYYNSNFDQSVWGPIYGSSCLNNDAEFHLFGSIPPFTGKRFIRPCADLKVFAGTVINGEDLAAWQRGVWAISAGYSTLTPSTPVSVSTTKEILAEYRYFVVNGRIVTGSLYRSGAVLVQEVLVPNTPFVQESINYWQPAPASVIDIALTQQGFRIIEINTINSSGFYACDPQCIVHALVELED